MILLRKTNKTLVQMLQQGGPAPNAMAGVGAGIGPQGYGGGANSYVKLDITHPDIMPNQGGGTGRTGRGSSPRSRYGRPPKKASEKDPKAGQGFLSDMKYAENALKEINDLMSQKTTENPAYVGSDEWKADKAVYDRATRQLAGVKALRDNYKVKMKGKKFEDGALAIHGDMALVRDSENPNEGPKLVSLLDEALTATNADGSKRYRILTIGTAQAVRDQDIDFNGFETPGQQLETIIKNSYNQSEVNKQINDEFKTAGITNTGTQDILLDIQGKSTSVPIGQLFKYLGKTPEARAEAIRSMGDKNNLQQLEYARITILKRLKGNTGMYDSLRNMAIAELSSSGVSQFKGKSAEDVGNMVEDYVQTYITNKARQFIKQEFKDTVKFDDQEEDGTAAADNKDASRPINNVQRDMMLADTPVRLDYGGYGKYATSSVMVYGVKSTESVQLLKNGYVQGETQKTLANNTNLAKLIHGSMAQNVTLADGTPLAELNGGLGIESAVPYGSDVHFYMGVPTIQENGVTKIAGEELKVMEKFVATLEEAYKQRKQKTGKELTIEEKENLYEIAHEKQLKNDKEYEALNNKIQSGAIKLRTMAAFDVVVPENMTKFWMYTTPDGRKLKTLLSEVSNSEYDELNPEGRSTGHGSYRTRVFAPINSAHRLYDFQGIKDDEVTAEQIARERQSHKHYQDQGQVFSMRDFIVNTKR